MATTKTAAGKETSASKAAVAAVATAPVPKAPAQRAFDPYTVILNPLSTEKSIRQIEFDNKLVFSVGKNATKFDVKRAVEQLFKARVMAVNIQNSISGKRKAYVKLSPGASAADIGADLGLI